MGVFCCMMKVEFVVSLGYNMCTEFGNLIYHPILTHL